ncbi:hypothetical protein D3C71_1834340 [compost metagenome]
MPTVLLANSTLAMGTPLTRLFLLPQKTAVISSSLPKPRRRERKVVRNSARARMMAQITSSPTRVLTDTCRQMPCTTAALKAV